MRAGGRPPTRAQPRRAAARRGGGPDAVPARARGHGPRRSLGVEPRPVERRPRRRGGLGSRCARHEGAGRRRGRRRASRWHPRDGGRRAASCWSSRRPTRRPARPTERSGCARSAPTSCARTSSSTRAAGPRSSATGGASTPCRSARRASSGSRCARTGAPATGRCRGSGTTPCSSSRRRWSGCAASPHFEATPEGVEFLSQMLGEAVAADHAGLASAIERLRAERPGRGRLHRRADPRGHARRRPWPGPPRRRT